VEKLVGLYVTACKWNCVGIVSPRSWRRPVGVAVHPWSFRSYNSGCKNDFHYVWHDWKKSSASSARFSTLCQPVRYTLLFNSVSEIRSSQWAVQLVS